MPLILPEARRTLDPAVGQRRGTSMDGKDGRPIVAAHPADAIVRPPRRHRPRIERKALP